MHLLFIEVRKGYELVSRQFGGEMVPPTRFERVACPLGGDRSIQLSYGGF